MQEKERDRVRRPWLWAAALAVSCSSLVTHIPEFGLRSANWLNDKDQPAFDQADFERISTPPQFPDPGYVNIDDPYEIGDPATSDVDRLLAGAVNEALLPVTGNEQELCTAFKVAVDGVQYLLTARHCPYETTGKMTTEKAIAGGSTELQAISTYHPEVLLGDDIAVFVPDGADLSSRWQPLKVAATRPQPGEILVSRGYEKNDGGTEAQRKMEGTYLGTMPTRDFYDAFTSPQGNLGVNTQGNVGLVLIKPTDTPEEHGACTGGSSGSPFAEESTGEVVGPLSGARTIKYGGIKTYLINTLGVDPSTLGPDDTVCAYSEFYSAA